MLPGKEICIFFGQYGLCGILGIIISSIIIGILINKVLKILSLNKSIDTYDHFLNYILEYENLKVNLVKVFNTIINIFLLISFYIMIAGFAAYFKQQYNLPTYITASIVCILCYITLNKNIEGVIKIAVILVPIIILFILNMGINNFKFGIEKIINMKFNNKFLPQSIISAILYASYNSILLLPVVVSLKKYIKKKHIFSIAMIISSILTILGILLYIILLRGNTEILQLDMPIIYITKEFGKIYEILYGFVIIISIFTSVISSGYSFLKNCSKDYKQYAKKLKFICISSVFVCNIGFSELVNLLYPVFGMLGIIQIYCILKIKTE